MLDAAAQKDWDKAVLKANENRRYAIRRAAGHKVAQAGDAAVPAIGRYEKAKGRNNIVLTLIDSISRAKTTGPLTRGLLQEWAGDRNFYWRSQALTGLANRALPELRDLYLASLNDPSHLYRIAAAKGLLLLPTVGEDLEVVLPLLRDTDPRVRLRVGICLLEINNPHGIAPVAESLQSNGRIFLDDPWGQRNATQGIRALEKFADRDFGYRSAEDDKARQTALTKINAYAVTRIPATTPRYTPPELKPNTTTGGFDIRSCRLGDLFVQWTADGLVSFGLEQGEQVQISSERWTALTPGIAKLAGTKIHGRVVCDYIRIRIEKPDVHQKCAPASLPKPITKWLQSLADGIKAAGREDLAKRITQRLTQFVSDDKK